MKHLKLFEEFEAYNEFGLEDKENINKAHAKLKELKLEYHATEGGGITFFVFENPKDLQVASDEVAKVIDKTKEQEW